MPRRWVSPTDSDDGWLARMSPPRSHVFGRSGAEHIPGCYGFLLKPWRPSAASTRSTARQATTSMLLAAQRPAIGSRSPGAFVWHHRRHHALFPPANRRKLGARRDGLKRAVAVRGVIYRRRGGAQLDDAITGGIFGADWLSVFISRCRRTRPCIRARSVASAHRGGAVLGLYGGGGSRASPCSASRSYRGSPGSPGAPPNIEDSFRDYW